MKIKKMKKEAVIPYNCESEYISYNDVHKHNTIVESTMLQDVYPLVEGKYSPWKGLRSVDEEARDKYRKKKAEHEEHEMALLYNLLECYLHAEAENRGYEKTVI